MNTEDTIYPWKADSKIIMVKTNDVFIIDNEDKRIQLHGNATAFRALKANIKANGILQPLTILPDRRLIDGTQRFKAAKQLKLDEVPCQVMRLRINEVALEALRAYASGLKAAMERHGIKPKDIKKVFNEDGPLDDDPEAMLNIGVLCGAAIALGLRVDELLAGLLP